MANKTSIEWTDYNWNFLRGCSRVSEGCRNCYAEGVAARFSGEGLPYEGLAKFVDHKPRWTGEISFHEDILQLPLRWTKPRKVFVNSMSDLFHEKVTDDVLDKAFAVMALTPQHTYQILTKRPERMKAYLEKANRPPVGTLRPEYWRRWHIWTQMYTYGDGAFFFRWADEIKGLVGQWPLPNVWLGVSVEDQKTYDERVPLLLDCPTAIRWLSVEPLLSYINFNFIADNGQATDIDWVVVGGESGPNARAFDISWARQIIDQCKAADVAVFIKQLGAKVLGRDCEHGRRGESCSFENKKGGDINEWPEDLRVREYPRANTLPNGRVSACEQVSA